MKCDYCTDDANLNVKVSDIKTKCKYHKKIGAIYPVDSIAPEKMCLELFHAAYSGCFALLYNGMPVPCRPRGRGLQEITACCPAPDGVKVQITVKEILPPAIRMLKDICAEMLKKFYHGYDSPFRRVIMEVIQSSPNCPKAYSMGDKFEFNINSQKELCPAGFVAIYPYLRLLKENKKKGLSDSIYVHCPDYVGVIYELTMD